MKLFQVPPRFFQIAIPLFIEFALTVLVSYIATYLISQYSDRVMGSISVANQFLNMLLLLFQIVSGGAGILLSQAVGADATHTKNKIFTVAVIYAFIFGLMGMVFFLLFSDWLFSFFTLAPDVLLSAKQYAFIISLFFPFQAVSFIFTQVLYAHSATKIGVLGNAIAAFFQLLTIVLFLYGNPTLGIPELGIAGVGLGWVMGRAIYLIFAFLYVTFKIRVHFQWSSIKKSEKGLTGKMFRVGLPSTLEHMTYNLMMIVITALITSFDEGTTSIIAKSYFDNLAQWSYFVTAGVSGAIAIFVGQYVGARQMNQAEKTTRFGMVVSVTSSVIPSFLMVFTMGVLAGFFTDDPLVITLMQQIILVDFFLEIGRALNMIYGRALKSAGDAMFPLWNGILVEWLFTVPLAFLFGQTLRLGLVGVWIALMCDELIRGFINFVRWQSRKWQAKALIQKQAVKDPAVRILR